MLENGVIKCNKHKIITRMYFFKKVLKIERNAFLSKMLSDSAMTIEGIKIIFSPFSHFSKISEAFKLILELFVNHQRRACVSATKFI